MKTKIIFSIFTILAVLLVMPAIAQATLPGSAETAPIDGGLSLLVAAGVAYGMKRVRDKRKNNSDHKNK